MKRRSRTKKVSYVLQVQCDKIPEMNEKEFLQEIRYRLRTPDAPGSAGGPIGKGESYATVSVIQRTETFLSAKDSTS